VGHEACSARLGLFRFFYDDYPVNERLPRYFEVKISDTVEHGSVKMRAFINGKQIGGPLTDNAIQAMAIAFTTFFTSVSPRASRGRQLREETFNASAKSLPRYLLALSAWLAVETCFDPNFSDNENTALNLYAGQLQQLHDQIKGGITQFCPPNPAPAISAGSFA
jgi:hypothetical protein